MIGNFKLRKPSMRHISFRIALWITETINKKLGDLTTNEHSGRLHMRVFRKAMMLKIPESNLSKKFLSLAQSHYSKCAIAMNDGEY